MNQSRKIAIAWYYPHQWNKIRSYSKDRTGMAKDYLDWERKAQETVHKWERDGYIVQKVYLDVQMLVVWCKRRRVPVDPLSRSDYVNHLLAERLGLTSDV